MLKRMLGRWAKNREPAWVTVVSGLPRSGTSMMMAMLEAGGIPGMTDEIRGPDPDNPKGYYEFERVKKLAQGDDAWLAEAQGKAVKIISELLRYLPPRYPYRVIFMRRAMPEILASQKQMLARRGKEDGGVSDEDMARMYERHLQKVDGWLSSQTDLRRLDVNYNELVADPNPHAAQVNQFLEGRLDVEKMIAVLDRNLYRQRSA